MKTRLLWALLSWLSLLSFGAQAQTTLASEGFEGASTDYGYTASPTITGVAYQYFERQAFQTPDATSSFYRDSELPLSTGSSATIRSLYGANIWTAEGVRGFIGNSSNRSAKVVQLRAIPTTGYRNLRMVVAFASARGAGYVGGGANDVATTDRIRLQYSFNDGATWTTAGLLLGNNGTTGNFQQDTSSPLDSIPNGDVMSPTLSDYTANISGTGTNLLVRVVADTRQPSFAFDNIRVLGDVDNTPKPTLNIPETTPASYTEGGSSVQLSGGLTVGYSDNLATNITGGTVNISAGFGGSTERLNFVNQLGITGSYSTGNGTLTLSGTTTQASYQTALRSITYSSINSTTLPSGTRQITFQLSAGGVVSNSPVRIVNVTQALNNPAALTTTYTEPFDTDGEGLRYASDMFFNASGPVGFFRSTTNPPSSGGTTLSSTTYGGTSGGFWYGEGTTSALNPKNPFSSLQLAPVNASGYTKVRFTLALGASGSWAPYQNTDNVGDWFELFYSTDGGTTLTKFGAFYGTNQLPRVGPLQDDDLNPVTPTTPSANLKQLSSTLQNVLFELPSAAFVSNLTIVLRQRASINAEIAFDNIRITGVVPPTVTTAAATSLTTTSAVLGGSVTADGGDAVTARGVVYSTTNQTPAIGGTSVRQDANGTGTGSFSETIAGLAPGTLYYVRAYASNSVGTSYGAVQPFTTLTVPTVTTDAATSITTTSAVLGGSVTADGGTSVTERGVVYSTTNATPTTNDTKAANGTGTGAFSATISGLASRTTYNVRAYASNSVGTSYGVVQPFTTLNNPPVVTTTGGTTTYIIGGGAVAIDNGLTVTDADNTTLASAKVTITSGLQSGQDVVMFTNTNTTTFGNIGSAASANGTLPLASSGGTATVAQWQAALRAVTFDNMNGTAPTVRTVSFVVNDGTTDSAPATKTITFAPATTVVSVTRLTPSPTATAQVRYQVVFSRNVSGLTVGNFNTTTTGSVTVNGTGVSTAVGSGTTYTVTVNTGTGDGTLRLNVNNNAGISPTVSGLPYTAGETYTITKSFAANPQLTIQGAGSTGRDVTAFVDAVQVLSGGTAVANALRNGSFETHNPLANGGFGYQPTGADWTFNAQAGIAESGSAFTPTTPIPNGIAVAFVQSLVDINNQRQNGQLQQNLAVPTGSYQVNFQAAQRVCCTTLDQSLNVFLNGVFIGTIQPGSDNYTAFTSATFSVSAPALTASISSTAGASGSTTATSPIPFAVTFSQNVTGFTASDVTITGGTLTGFSGSGATYTFNITPSASGTIMVNVPANSAFDGNNTGNLAAEQYTLSYSQPVTAAPVVTAPANGTFVNITNPTYSGTAPASSTVTVYVDGSSVGTTTATTSGTFVLTQPTALAQGSHTVRGTAQASGSAVSANSNTNTFTVDQTAPTVAITSTAGTNGSTTTTTPIPYTVTFSEAVTGFVQGDVSVSNGTIAGFSGSGTTYTFNVTPTTAGTATTVNVPANVAVDRAGNGNSAAIQLSITYQQLVTTAPVVTTPANGSMLNTATPTYIGTAPANSTVTVYVDNTAIGTTTAPGGTFSLTQPASLADGSHTVRATAQLSGNTVSTSSNTNTFIVDATAPTVVLGSTATNPTSTSPIPVTVTFSESVTGFVGGDVTVSNGTLGNFSGSGSLYTFSVTPASNGTVTVDISANVAQDAASNGNTAATQFTITYAAPITVTTWTGNVSTDWFTAGNWTAGIPNAAVDAIIPTNVRNYPVLAANAATKNLGLNSGATLTQTTGTLDVRGNLTNNGTFAANGGTMALGASTQANILGSSNTRFWNLAIGANGAQLSTSASTSVQRVMTLDGGFATNGNPLTLESNNVGAAMLVNNGSNVVSGNVTVQRYISPVLNPNLGYRHFSSPIRTGTVASLATNAFSPVVNPAYNTLAVPGQARPFPTVFGYDQSRIATVTNSLPSFDKGWFSPSALSDALTVGQGYAVNLPANQTITQTGPQNNGNIVLNLSRNAGPMAAESGLALVGNPYPSPLNWQQVDATDRPGLDGVIYTFISNDPTNPYAGSYGFYNNGFGTILPVLPLGQGFFVRVSQGQTGATLTLKNSHRATAYASPTYQRTAETRPVVHLTLKGTGNALSDDAFVYFEQGASEGFDPQYDAVKIPNTNGLNLSTSVTGQQFSIDGRPELGSVQRVVPLAVGVPTPGSYALASAELLNLAATPVYLRDLQLGTLTDLRLTPNYQFTVTNSSALITSRFELVFSPQQALATVPAALAQQVALYPNPAKKAAFVELPASLGRQAVTATLVDALGRQVRTVQLHAQGSVAHPLDLSDLATGVYALRLSTNAGVVVKKLVIE